MLLDHIRDLVVGEIYIHLVFVIIPIVIWVRCIWQGSLGFGDREPYIVWWFHWDLFFIRFFIRG
jgi:hypothetical protein